MMLLIVYISVASVSVTEDQSSAVSL